MFLAEAAIQLVPDGTLLLHMLVVAIMVFVLNRTLLRPINQILAEREKLITGSRTEASSMAAEAEQKLRKYNEALHEARVDGYRLLEKERTEGLKQREEKLRVYRGEMSKEVTAQLETIRTQEETVKRELETQAAAMSELISSKILRRPAS